MPSTSPRHIGSPPPRRLLAVGAAASITVATVAGGLGFGPGTALAQTSHISPDSATGSAANATPEHLRSGAGPSGGSWLKIDRSTQGSGSASQDGAGSPTANEPTATPLPAKSGSGKRVVFDIGDQRVWLVGDNGRVVRTYLVSGSLHDNLQPGTYEVYSKSRHAVSFNSRETMGFMVRFAQGENAPIGFHDIPRRPDGTRVEKRSQLGTPQSAGCIRQWPPDAKALWQFAAVGTAVVVTS